MTVIRQFFQNVPEQYLEGGIEMPVITKDTGIIEAVQKYPQIIQIFQAYGLGCIGCMAAHFETIGEGAGAHGIDVDALVADLNECIAASKN